MSILQQTRVLIPALIAAAGFAAAGSVAAAETAPAPTKPAAKAPAKPAAKPAVHHATHATTTKSTAKGKHAKAAPAPVAEAPLPPASEEQVAAAEKIFYGESDCEFKQKLDIAINPKYPAYVDVKFDKKSWTMRPVVSSTGALRLEDVKNQAVMIQIAQKSMLLNTVTGQRMVDECVSAKQRELAALAAQASDSGKDALAIAPTPGK